jgi:hypothetical protein
MAIAAAVSGGIVLGFLAGLFSFKKSEQFCAEHGVTKTCQLCIRGGVPTVRS